MVQICLPPYPTIKCPAQPMETAVRWSLIAMSDPLPQAVARADRRLVKQPGRSCLRHLNGYRAD